jgi:hypothetical protein
LYTGGDLFFNFRQAFTGANVVNWDSISITLNPAAAPSAVDLGVLGAEGSYDIDTFGSNFDTELGLYDSTGNLIANNDDAGGGLQSQVIESLTEGTYFVVVGGFNTVFGNQGWAVGAGTRSGDYLLNINGVEVASSFLPSGQVSWYTFTVVPTPSTAALLGLGGLMAARRRR